MDRAPRRPIWRAMADVSDFVLSFYRVRQAVGALGLAMPVGLIAGSLLLGDPLPPALSDYYYTPMRDIFVGILVALGVFLGTYSGHREPVGPVSDRWVSRAAGIGAIGIAVFPNDTLDPCDGTSIFQVNPVGVLHVASAGLFLAMTALFCLVLFQRSGTAHVRPQKRRRNLIYTACGLTIIAALGALGVYFVGLSAETRCALVPLRPVLWLEVVTVLAFGLAWLVKGRGIVALNDARDAGLAPSEQ